jgi:thiamine-phosphate pyrophosphorylase
MPGRTPALVLVTDRHATGGRDLVAVARAALEAGLPAIQLRDKDLPGRPLLALAQALRAETHRTGALLFVNDRLDVALAAEADGVHLGAASVPVEVARRLLPPRALVGLSTHAPAEIASASGADFCFFGPVHATPSKAGAGPPQGLARLAEAVRVARVPVLAIGGISAREVAGVREAGAAGVAVVRAILGAADPAAATRELLAALDSDVSI